MAASYSVRTLKITVRRAKNGFGARRARVGAPAHAGGRAEGLWVADRGSRIADRGPSAIRSSA
eukprot:gene10491-23255_t